MAKETAKTLDHDLLIAVNTKLERVIADIRELKDNVAQRVSVLEQDKLDKTEASRIYGEHEVLHEKLDSRVTQLEGYKSKAMGALVIIQLVLGFIMTMALKYFNQ